MSDIPETQPQPVVSGKKFLYRQPEILTAEAHEDLGFTPPERPFDHVRSVSVLPLTMTEFGSAQRHYPIVFSDRENPVPLAVMSLLDESNLFVTEDGTWDPMCYLPTYLRCYPFTLAKQGEDRMTVVVDRAADAVSRNPEYPFFVDGVPSEQTQSLIELCRQYDVETRKTEAFCARLRELGLLTEQQARYTPEGSSEQQTLAGYVCVDADRLNRLTDDVVVDLHKSGQLAAIYLHLYSLENWRHLMARRIALGGIAG